MATRRDVAQRAGVSVATVSYVMNNTKNVTPEVRERVMRAVGELDYRPNLLARGLSTRETRHVAMLVDNLSNPHYCEVLSGAQEVASKNGYIVSVISVDFSNTRDVLDLASRWLDGAILALPTTNEQIESLLPPSLPVINHDVSITFDYRRAFDDMIGALKRAGHRDIAFLSGVPLSTPNHWRYAAWREALARHGLPVNPDLIVDGLPSARTDEAEGMRAAEILMERGAAFTAVYALNDLMALGTIRALHNRGLRVPGDISVVGCDRLKILQSITPTLATMDIRGFEVGRFLMRSLISKIAGRCEEPLTVSVDFVMGESVAPIL